MPTSFFLYYAGKGEDPLGRLIPAINAYYNRFGEEPGVAVINAEQYHILAPRVPEPPFVPTHFYQSGIRIEPGSTITRNHIALAAEPGTAGAGTPPAASSL